VALENEVRVVSEPTLGYGAACMKGFAAAQGKYLFLADPDGSYDFEEIPHFLGQLEEGCDFVLGNRFQGKIDEGAMPWSHRYIGNPLLSSILRLFYNTKIHDVHCGMRAITKSAFQSLPLLTTGMEFASEMIVVALKKNLRITEIPINYHPRQGVSKLRRLSDAWRHLRFMLLYKPLVLFFFPGILLFSTGIISLLLLYFDGLKLFHIQFHYHPMFLSCVLIIIGYQLIIFALFAKTYAITHLGDRPIFDKLYQYLNIEMASLAGLGLVAVGGIIYLNILLKWIGTNFGALNEVKNSVLALTFIVLGIQTIFSGFMLSILGIKRK
jgi:glycosyltransferase involved in cell wall biosynthesis